jgi:hypothetical protein
MLNQHIYILALKSVQLAIHQSQVSPIAVTADSAEGTECSQLLGHLNTTNIACMPNLVAGFKVMQVLIIPIAMGIAQYANSYHNPKR